MGVPIDWTWLIVRWFHIVPAVVLGGGLIFMWLVGQKAAAQASVDGRPARRPGMRRWAMIVHLCVLLILLSGLYNYFFNTRHQHEDQAIYHAVWGIKFLLGLLVFFLAEALAGKAGVFAAIRRNAPTWWTVAGVLVIVVVLLGGVLRAIPVVTAAG